MKRAAFLLLLVSAGAYATDDAWERLGERDGILVERRAVLGSPTRELRASTHSSVSPAQFMTTLWKHEEYPEFMPYVIHLDVLRDDGDTKLIYEQVKVPFAKDRDIVARLRRSVTDGVYEVTSTAVPDEGPRATDKFVRVRTSRGHWLLAPAADGGTDLTYTVATDPGGLLPGWVLSAIQKEGTLKMLRAILDRAARSSPR